MAATSGYTQLGRYKTFVYAQENGRRVRRLVEVELQADLASLAATLAWSATRSRQRPKQSTMSHRRIVATVTRETPTATD